MVDAARARKLADRISQIVAEMLERRIKDPRLGFVTVTEARLTNDLREATVYYTVYGTDAERADTAAALHSATGIIRSEVGRQLGLRHTPSLEFVADVLPDNAQRIEELVSQAKDADTELARSRQGAQYAGDPDPYRKPAEDDDEDDE
jgi:ribosome-binding factor A